MKISVLDDIKNPNELLKFMEENIEYVKEINLFENVLLNNLYICEYDELPYNINSKEFFSYIINNGKDITFFCKYFVKKYKTDR